MRWPDGSARLILNAHHLLVDGWSTPLIVQALLDCHNTGRPAAANTLAKYGAAATARMPTAADNNAWAEAFTGAQPTLLEGTLLPRAEPGDPGEASRELDAGITAALTTAAQKHGVTHNSVFALAHALMLSELTGRNDVVFGTTVSGREDDDVQDIIGLFTNTVPVRVQLNHSLSPAGHLAGLQSHQAELREHATLGLAQIQQLAGTGTLFDTLFVMENYPADEHVKPAGPDGLAVSAVRNRGYTHYPLTILCPAGREGLEGGRGTQAGQRAGRHDPAAVLCRAGQHHRRARRSAGRRQPPAPGRTGGAGSGKQHRPQAPGNHSAGPAG